jgi:purine-binding chemotaxis protein CheW
VVSSTFAVNLRQRLELPPTPSETPAMNVMVRSVDGAVSLQVDEIGDVVEVEESIFEPPPETLRASLRVIILGIHKLNGRLLHVLDIEKAWQIMDVPEPASIPR